jgi:Dyp-type peroxidase family
MEDFLESENIDTACERVKKMLGNIQGNILKGHGRNHTVHLFFQFSGDPAENRKLVQLLSKEVTSAEKQLDDTKQRKRNGTSVKRFCNFFLTARGYKSLGFFPHELNGFKDPYFLFGMEHFSHDLGDPPRERWDSGYADISAHAANRQLIDGMLLLANDDLRHLEQHEKEVVAKMRGHAVELVVERGHAMFNKAETENVEHFGYVDGLSQPTFFSSDRRREDENGGTDQWDPSAPLKLVLVPDPLIADSDASLSFGSYLVFRKLEQNVRAFKETEENLAKALSLGEKEAELAGALAVGRFEDGTPVVLMSKESGDHPIQNNFRFQSSDPNGYRCPFHSHIRKVNPRGETGEPNEGLRRIARRGITYGLRTVLPSDDPESADLPANGVGLLFMCFQASIAEQFAYIQQRFANSPDFLRQGVGIDPIIGPTDFVGQAQKWPQKWGEAGGYLEFDFPCFVRLLGGEFFFAPSIVFLENVESL